MALRAVRSSRLYEGVLVALREFVDAGHIRPGDPFPSERVLEQQLKVSRPVLREAFRVLEAQGIVRTRQGGGRYLVAPHLPSLESLRRSELSNSAETLFALWDAREPVEIRAAELAAVHRTMEDLLAIERPVRLIGVLPSAEYREADLNLEYHLAIANASKNPFLVRLIHLLLEEFRQIDFKHLLAEEQWSDLQGTHRAIYEAIAGRNAGKAAEAMKAHFDDLRKSVVLQMQDDAG